MQTQPSGTVPLSADAHEASAIVEGLKFGVFRRWRSLRGADVFPRGLPTRGARPVEQVPLAEALLRLWDEDQHLVPYTSDQPFRINNAAVSKVRVDVWLLALDVDNHDDVAGWMDGERAKIAALLSEHPGGYVYSTKRGWRVFYALPRPFPIRSEADKAAFVLFYARVASYVFERFGIVADDALIRWNQPIRLPHVVRDGHAFEAEIIAGDAHAIGVFALPDDVPSVPDLRALARELPRWGGVAKRWQPKRKLFRVVASADFGGIPLPPYAERVAAAATWAREHAPRAIMGQGGRATARSVAATLFVGFALEREDVERILAGAYNRRRCSPPWSEAELGDLRAIAHAVASSPIHTWGFMLTRDRTGIEAARATLAAAAAARNVVPLDDVSTRILAAVNEHRAVVLRATCGAGKTHALVHHIAMETSARVFVVVSTHRLGREWVEGLAEAGVTDVAYHASVVQRRDDAGKRHCDQKIALRLYASGGDVAHDICPSCSRAPTCPAYAERPNARARVHVLPREMIARVGITDEDLVVFDDSAVDLLAWHRLGVRRLQRLSGADPRLLPPAQWRHVSAFVAALLAGPRQAEQHAREALGAPVPVGMALRQLAARAIDGQRSPHIAPDMLKTGRDEFAATLRDVGTLRDVLRFASACADGADVHWSADMRSVHGESVAAKLLRSHRGRLVVLDAAANVEELRVHRSDLHVEHIDVDDAGDTKRVLFFAPNATRAGLLQPSERNKRLAMWLECVLAHLTARTVLRPVFVVYKALIAELREHPLVVAWLAEDPRRTMRTAHYGAVRGLNRFRRCDAVVTLGDPWLNGDDVIGRAGMLGLDEPSYRIALATAELGQAHGRSRSVRRPERLTHVHVGRLVPDGWAAGVLVEPLGGPPERTQAAADRLEFSALVGALGGNRGASAALGWPSTRGCSPSAIAGWRAGPRALPRHILERLRNLVATTRNDPASSGRRARARGARKMDAPVCINDPKERVHAAALAVSVSVIEQGEGLPEGSPIAEEAKAAVRAATPLSPPEIFLSPHHRDAGGERDEDVPRTDEEERRGASLPHRFMLRNGLVQRLTRADVAPSVAEVPAAPPQRTLPAGAAAAAPATARVVRPERASVEPPGTQAAFAARVLAVLEEIEPTPARSPPRARTGRLDEEREGERLSRAARATGGTG